jgi:phosphoserine aminotransferase
MNLAREGRPGDYVVTGIWARKALEEARLLGMGREAWSGAAHGFDRLPPPDIRFGRSDSAYVHVCTNNTIYGTQFAELPDTGAVPLVCDMSSDILSRRRDFARCALIYAGAQKNLGPAGLTVVALRRGLLGPEVSGLPRILDYRAHIEADGLFHTPPVGAVYLMDLVLEWIEAEGGLEVVERRNEEKAAILYAALDEDDFYRGCARPEARSRMNVTFRLPTEDLERRFLAEARSRGFVGLAGHRSVGGIRASLYNALPRSSVEALAGFMQGFARRHWKFQETRS